MFKEDFKYKCCVSVVTAFVVFLAMSITATGQDKSDSDDDTLRYYLSKSEVVVVGKVTDGMQRIGVNFDPIPVSEIGCQVKVTKWIKGKVAEKETITVTVTRAYEIGTSVPPEQGEELVLFLRASGDSWVSTDKWFGIQPYSLALVEHLERVKRQVRGPMQCKPPRTKR